MIGLDTGTPGAGKTLINVSDLVKQERENERNLLRNPKIFEYNNKILQEKNLFDEVTYLMIENGQGVALVKELLSFDSDYFNLFSQTERVEDYFQRSIYYNDIVLRVNEEHDLTLQSIRPVRTIYTNIKGLKLENTRPLPENCDWRTCPDGSIIVIDEIQNIPMFSIETRSVDPILKDMTIHRHRGFDIRGITQFPNLVHKNFLALVGHHRHLVNGWGLKSSTVYHWSTVKQDPNAYKNKAVSEKNESFKFPKHLYKYYKSSTAHTHKLRLPLRFIFWLVLALVVAFSIFTFALSDNNNFISKMVTGEVSQDANGTTNNTDNPDLSNSSPSNQDATNKTNPNPFSSASTSSASIVIDSESIDDSASAPVATDSATAFYDPSKPFDFVPLDSPSVVNHRVFSGCFCTKNECFAVDQQGTRIKGFTEKSCRELLDKSYNRPFDYFRSAPPVQVHQQNTEQLDDSVPSQRTIEKPIENPNVIVDNQIIPSQSVYVANKGYKDEI